MLPRNHTDRIRIALDDRGLVTNAGLVLPVTLAQHLGLPQLAQKHLERLYVIIWAETGVPGCLTQKSAPSYTGGRWTVEESALVFLERFGLCDDRV